VVGVDEHVHAAGVGGVGVEDFAGFILVEHAHAVDFGHGGLAAVVVVGGAGLHFFGGESDAEVAVEVAAGGGHPLEPPAHALAEGLQFGERRARHGDHGGTALFQVRQHAAVVVVGEQRAAFAAFLPRRVEHEMVDD